MNQVDPHAVHDDDKTHAGHDHTRGASARSLKIALALTSVVLIAELGGAYLFNSLALLSDAGHMFTDAAALVIALIAVRLGARPPDDRRTYGYRRFEILAAAFNAILLLMIALFVLYQAVLRFFEPSPVHSLGMLGIAALGLVANLIGMRVLAAGREESFNMKGAYLEAWADMIGSLGVLIAAGVIYATGWQWVDPLVAAAIGLWVLPRAWTLLRDTCHILLQGVPKGVDITSVRSALEGIDGVHSVHDLHVWSVAGDDISLTVHCVLVEAIEAEAARVAALALLRERFGIDRATVQTEAAACVAVAHRAHR